ncbi:MAG: GNAT family N-acetyltransferase [Chloroflexi bacterium]|nr:GNAT family N-acetyltransferase [Chloroflexota bacterium]
MALKQLRRIGASAGQSLHDELSHQALGYAWSRTEIDRIEQEHPELIVPHEGNVLAALVDNAALAYAFRSDGQFIEHFEAMFEELLPRIRRSLGADSVRFRLTHYPSRPKVEPVLRRLWFAAGKPWLGFSLSKKTALPKLAPLKGIKFRDGGVDDVPELIRLDRQAFPDTPIPTPVMRHRLETVERVLIAESGGSMVGYATYLQADPGEGYLHTLVVDEAQRGRGIGAALTVKVAKRLFAGGADRMDLKTDEDNTAAIRLYMKLGFKQNTAGCDYSRPTDQRAITRLKKTSEGTVIRFGGWR